MSIELIKVVSGAPLEHLKNAFLSLALPTLVFSEPAPPARTLIREGLSFTAWDRWEVRGSSAMKLQEFLKAVKVGTRRGGGGGEGRGGGRGGGGGLPTKVP